MKKAMLVLCAFVLLATSCSIGRKKINNPGDIGNQEVLVVGKVVYDPPMTKETQNIQVLLGDEMTRYKTWFVCGTKLRTIEDSAVHPMSPDLQGAIETVQGQTFYTTNNKYPIYLIGGIFYKEIYTVSCGYNCSQQVYKGVLVPGSFYLDIKPEDKAIYVGTIKYTRDNFWNIRRIQIIDEYNQTIPEFRAKFPGIKLRKALIREPAPGVVPAVGSSY